MGVKLTFLRCDSSGAVASSSGQARAAGYGGMLPQTRCSTGQAWGPQQPPTTSQPSSALPCCHSGSKWGFIVSRFAGPGRGRALTVSPQPGGAERGRGRHSSARSQLWPPALNAGGFCSLSPGRGLFPGRKPGKSTLLKCSGGLCNGKPSGFAKQMPQIRLGGCKERPLSAGRLPQCPTSPPSH